MKATIFIISILTFLGCSIKDKEENTLNKLQYIALKNGHNYFAKTDSGFVLRFATDDGWRYKEYVLKEDEIIMYDDSLYSLACMVNITYPVYYKHQGVYSVNNRSNREIEATRVVGGRFAYTAKLSSYTFPETMPHLKAIKFIINGHELSVDIDSVELQNLIPEFETLLYAKKKNEITLPPDLIQKIEN